jgi:ribonuclease HI
MFIVCTDGSCSGNPGPGGWCAIVKTTDYERTVSGNEIETTNQRMEITAVIGGLKAIPPRNSVVVISDSQYVINTMTKGWKRRANTDLWNELDILTRRQSNIEWIWVKGHDGHPDNERANQIAQKETQTAKLGRSYEVNGIHRANDECPKENSEQSTEGRIPI